MYNANSQMKTIAIFKLRLKINPQTSILSASCVMEINFYIYFLPLLFFLIFYIVLPFSLSLFFSYIFYSDMPTLPFCLPTKFLPLQYTSIFQSPQSFLFRVGQSSKRYQTNKAYHSTITLGISHLSKAG